MSRSNPEWKACLQATVQHWNQRKVSETARAKHQKLTCLILTLSFFSFSALFFWSSNCRKKHEMKRLKHNWMATKVQVKERKWHWHWDHLQQALLFFFIVFNFLSCMKYFYWRKVLYLVLKFFLVLLVQSRSLVEHFILWGDEKSIKTQLCTTLIIIQTRVLNMTHQWFINNYSKLAASTFITKYLLRQGL